MVLKEDIQEAKERLKAWWDGELLDRPCISYFCPDSTKIFPGIYDYWRLAKDWDDVEGAFDSLEKMSKTLIFGAENIPWFWPNYGPGIMAALFGVVPKFEKNGQTVWFNKPIPVDEIVSYLEGIVINNNNEWYDRLIRITEYAAKRAGKEISVALTDLGGVMDILSSFLGPTNIIVTMKRNPGILDSCREIILEALLKVYDKLQSIIEKYGDGSNSWIPIWCPKRYYPIQSDFSVMLSPKLFERFVLPDIVAQAEYMDYAVYHMDGPGQLIHLDNLLAEPSITCIQWVPGAGAEPASSEKWMPIYEKIQSAGKNLIVDNPFESSKIVTRLYRKLDPKRIFMVLIYFSEIEMEYYLPDFVGGRYGEGDYKQFKREYRRRQKQQQS